MNIPTPAIVTQAGARRFPRWALLLLCCAYVLSGFIGRDGWKSADMTALGYMSELAYGSSSWLAPTLMGVPTDNPAVLPYWLGAWAIQLTPAWASTDFMVRVPFGMLLALAMLATWYGTYYLARNPLAQPVAFAFGGEALPADYACAMADGGLLAFIACLGLAQLSHETTPALSQLGFSALFFYAVAALPYRRHGPTAAAAAGLIGLALSGAPSMAMLFGSGSAVLHYLDQPKEPQNTAHSRRITQESAILQLRACWHWRWQCRLICCAGKSSYQTPSGPTGVATSNYWYGLPGLPGPWPCGPYGGGVTNYSIGASADTSHYRSGSSVCVWLPH